jgi:hypothetical protein
MCPAPVWFQFLLGGCDYPALLSFDAVFAVIYICLKARQVASQVKQLKRSFVMLMFRVSGNSRDHVSGSKSFLVFTPASGC